jgi:DNA-binding transcriptional LysR family regulator
MGLDLNVLVVAREVERQHFNLAAAGRLLHLPGDRVSQMLLRLEDALGAALFERRGRRLAGLTPLGQEVWPRLMRLLEELDGIHLAVRDVEDSLKPEIHLACSAQVARELLPDALNEWPERRRGGRIRVFIGSAVELVDRVRRGHADLAIGSALPDCHPNLCWRLVQIVRPYWLVACRTPDVETLPEPGWLDEPLLTHSIGSSEWTCLLAAFARIGKSPAPSLQTDDIETLQRYVRLGLGRGLWMGVPSHLSRGLVAVPDGTLAAQAEIRVVWHRTRPMRVPVLSLLNLLAPGCHPFDTGGASP